VLHSFILRATFLGQFVEDEFLKLQLFEKNQINYLKAMKEKLASSENRLVHMTELEEEIARLKEELEKLKVERDNANKNVAFTEEKVSRCDKNWEELKLYMAVQHLAGFDKAVEQVQALFPDLDLAELNF